MQDLPRVDEGYTHCNNVGMFPALAAPAGFSESGVPIGQYQIVCT